MGCKVNKQRIRLDVESGEFIEFTVDHDAAAPIYAIEVRPIDPKGPGVVILKAPGEACRWPKARQAVDPGTYSISFGVVFVGVTKCAYKAVARRDHDVVVKDCSWKASDGVNPITEFEAVVPDAE